MHSSLLPSLLAPSSIALVGASARNFYSRNALQRLQDCGYAGRVHLVNPKGEPVWGRPCAPRVSAIGEPVEMVFIAVPRAAVMEALADAAASGVKAAVVVSNGFGESGDDTGRELQQELARFVERTPIAICGPSCLGVINVHARFQAFGGHPGTPILPGRISLVSQSGANVHSYVGAALARNLGFSHIVSSGNEAGIEITEYLSYFLDDARTAVLCAYAESFRSPEQLELVAQKALQRGKPLVVIKIGRSQSSVRAALAHTGAMTGPDAYFDTLFRQYGVLRADTIEEALDRALIFASSEPAWWPRSGRAGIVSVSGGFAATFSDLATGGTIDVPELDAESTAKLAEILPANVRPQNPIDISTQVQRDRPQAWAETAECMVRDAQVDLLLNAEAVPQSEARLETLLTLRRATGKTVLLASTSPHIGIIDDTLKAYCREHGLPFLQGVEGSRRAIEAALNFDACAQRVNEAAPAARTGDRRALAEPIEAPHEGVLHEVDARRLLSRFGIAGPREMLCDTPEEAAAASRDIAAPVALKIVAADITHRSDLGLVRLDVASPQVREVAAELLQRVSAAQRARCRIVVQEMVRGAAELFIGVDATLGSAPMLVVGFGGVLVELLGDRTSRLCPVDRAEAGRMLAGLRLFPALRGYRGRPAADLAAAAEAICAMSRFALASRGWLAQAEINPLIVRGEGEGAFAVDALIVTRAAATSPASQPEGHP